MRNSLFILLLLLSSFGADLLAQYNTVDKEEAIRIKKNEDLLYGEATGNSVEAAYESAFDDLMSTIRDYCEENPELCDADGIIVQNIRSMAKRIVYMKNVSTQAVCVYVAIKDILPLTATSDTSLEGANAIVLIKPDEEEPIVQRYVYPEIESDGDIVAAPEVKESALPEVSQTPMAQTPVEANDIVSTISQPQPERLANTTKESIILGDLLSLNNYTKVKQYLENRKRQRHDVMYKALKEDDGQRNCIWIMFDNQQNVVAILDRACWDYKAGRQMQLSAYVTNPRMWLIIYE